MRTVRAGTTRNELPQQMDMHRQNKCSCAAERVAGRRTGCGHRSNVIYYSRCVSIRDSVAMGVYVRDVVVDD